MLEKNELNKLVMRLADNQFLYKLDDSLMWLFNIETGEQYNLNESSYCVLSLFDGKRSVVEIRQLYVKKYSISGVCERDLIEDFYSLLSQLINAGAVTAKNNVGVVE